MHHLNAHLLSAQNTRFIFYVKCTLFSLHALKAVISFQYSKGKQTAEGTLWTTSLTRFYDKQGI